MAAAAEDREPGKASFGRLGESRLDNTRKRRACKVGNGRSSRLGTKISPWGILTWRAERASFTQERDDDALG
jgi:hypothetical protein